MQRRKSKQLRAALALSLAMLVLWPLMDFLWCSTQKIAPTAQAPDPTTISAPIPKISLATLSRLGYDDNTAFVQAVLATILATLFYCLLTRRASQQSASQTLCRRCKGILRGLTSPQCPACGEPL